MLLPTQLRVTPIDSTLLNGGDVPIVFDDVQALVVEDVGGVNEYEVMHATIPKASPS